MNEIIKRLADKAQITSVCPEKLFAFAQLVALECAESIMSSSDRYRREYFANMLIELFMEEPHEEVV